ncbi:MAG: hypothetical protein ACJA1A_002995 [Saprospiraceae bacterium]|jgi:hypothetical protein
MKKSKLFLMALLCSFAIVLIFSCSKDQSIVESSQIENAASQTNQVQVDNCSNPYHDVASYEDGAHVMENLIYVERDYNNVNDLDTKEAYFDHYADFDSENTGAMQTFDLHGRRYKELGHDGYVDFATSQGIVSNELNFYLKEFRADFVSFINLNHPSLEAYNQYIVSKGDELDASLSLCAYDKYLGKVYHVTLMGIGKYLYDAQHALNLQKGMVGARAGCEGFWQNLICGTGGGTVAALVGATVGGIKWLKSVFTGDKDGQDVDLIEALYQVYQISVDMWNIGVSFYDWCCEALYNDLQECGEPTGAWKSDLSCGEYQLNIVGPGSYTITDWKNLNTIPAQVITNFPRLDVTIPDPQHLSRLIGEITCTDDSGSEQVDFDFFRQIGTVYQLVTPSWAWGNSPPQNASIGESFQFTIANPPTSESLYTMEITNQPGLNITLITGALYNCTPSSAGSFTITVTFTHICSGEIKTLQQIVTVN